MRAQRHFLGWDESVIRKVCGFVLPDSIDGPVDLGDKLIVVPTTQAGRRLREALALACSEHGTALLSTRVVMPTYFLRPEQASGLIASPMVIKAVWAGLLMKADLSLYSGFFSSQTEAPEYAWAMRTGEMIQQLRNTLADGCYRIADVPEACEEELEEAERWQSLAALETAYLERLEQLGLEDPCIRKIEDAKTPQLPDGVEQIIVAAVPDPSLLMIRALTEVDSQVSISILIHAPEEQAALFDDWGRPLPKAWPDQLIDIPDVDRNVILAGTPTAQSRRVLAEIARESDHLAPTDIAIGVPDKSVIPFIETQLAEHELKAFDPADKPLKEHPLYRLIEAFCGLLTDASYRALATFLRHPAVLHHLLAKKKVSPHYLLSDLDELQNRILPSRLEEVQKALANGEQDKPLPQAVDFVTQQLAAVKEQGFEPTIRSLLETVYEDYAPPANTPEADDFQSAARKLDATLRELRHETLQELSLQQADLIGLFLRALSEQTYHRDRTETLIDLEGWLELTWNDAAFLIITGMNEGFVPDGRLSDVFLPDALRMQLRLRDDAHRLARDMFLMRGFIASRKTTGRVCFIAGKTHTNGDPLRPSRLLFRCSDEDLPHRAEILFGAVEEEQANPASTISFTLNAAPPDKRALERIPLPHVSVTAFRDYLACPFRFYLKHVLRMRELDDLKRGPDAMDFGNMIHAAMKAMADDDAMSVCSDPNILATFLCGAARSWAEKRFAQLPLPVIIALHSACQRLTAAAQVQARLIEEGWSIQQSEFSITTPIGDMPVQGIIDRIDKHPDGRVRIIDYKSSDRESLPVEAHLAAPGTAPAEYAVVEVDGKEKRWVDLQLPLYRELLLRTGPLDEVDPNVIELAYFNLPKAVGHTGLYTWEGFTTDLAKGAGTCAEAIIDCISRRAFWPPAERVKYDDFETLFPADPALCIDSASFQAFMEEVS